MGFSIYGASLVGAILKALVLSQVVSKRNITSAFSLVTLLLIIQHSFEFLALFSLGENFEFSGLMVGGLLVTSYFLVASFIYLTLKINPIKHSQWISLGFWVVAVLLTIFQLLGLMTAGYEPVGYTIISKPGPLYGLFSSYILIAIPFAIYVLVMGKKSQDKIVAMRSGFMLMALLPVCIASGGVMIGKILEFDSSSAIVTAIATSLFVYMLMHYEKGDIVQFNFRWARLWFRFKQALQEWREVLPMDYKEQEEKFLLSYAMKATDYNAQRTSELTKFPRSTVQRKCEKYGIPTRPDLVQA